jgi:hypothetical protein
VVLQFCQLKRGLEINGHHQALAGGSSILSAKASNPNPILADGVTRLFVALKLKYHRLKPGGVPELVRRFL